MPQNRKKMKPDFSANSIKEFIIENHAMVLSAVVAVVMIFVFASMKMGQNEIKRDIIHKKFYTDSELAVKAPAFDYDAYSRLASSIESPKAMGEGITRDIFTKKQQQVQQADMKFCPDCGREIPREVLTCPYCGAPQFDVDKDEDRMPDAWELSYSFDPKDAADADSDADADGFSNLSEYLAGSDPRNPKVTPESMELVARFHVEKIYRKPVDLLFKGYIKLPGGGFNYQINWGKGTEFLRMGDKIRGYTIVDFVKKTIDEDRDDGTIETVDLSTLTLRKGDDPEIVLQIGKVTIARERYADIYDKVGKRRTTVYIGSALIDYKVIDITNREVVISDSDGNVFRLTRQRR